MADTYRIIRHYAPGSKKDKCTIKTGLTLEQAQAHCKDPETSSSTATGEKARGHTKLYGDWFDGYTKE